MSSSNFDSATVTVPDPAGRACSTAVPSPQSASRFEWIAKLGGKSPDLAPDGKRVAVLTAVGAATQQNHQVVFLENFFDFSVSVPLDK